MSAHRYWRILVPPDGRPAAVVYIAEVELRESVGGPDATGSGTASAYFSNLGAAANAFDNNATTYFGQSITPAHVSLTYDFGAGVSKDILQVAMSSNTTTATNQPSKFSLQYSDDGKTFKTLYASPTVTWSGAETKLFNISQNVTAKISDTMFLSASLLTLPATKAVPWAHNGLDEASSKRLAKLPYFGLYKIAGSTTVLGIPSAKRVQLHEQKSGLLIAVANTGADGAFLFDEIPSGTFTVIGVDETGQQNSVIYAHVESVPR